MSSLINVDSLTDQLIRPPKFTYSLADLGDSIFYLDGRLYERLDFYVNVDGNYGNEDKAIKLHASLWRLRK